MKLNRVFKFLLPALTVGVIIFQLTWAGQKFVGYARAKVLPDRHFDAVSRSADVAYGSDFLAYISFLRQRLPQDAVVVDTRTFGLPQYDLYVFLQYFLFPRRIDVLSNDSCPGESSMKVCLQTMSGPHVYFMYGPNLTLSSAVPENLIVIPFDPSSGLLAPRP
jgi:hypothetical protein